MPIGIGLMFAHRMILRITLLLLWLQIAGTFQTFVLLPHAVFQNGNPLLSTIEGQYAIKTLVLLTAGLVIGCTVPRKNPPDMRAAGAATPATSGPAGTRRASWEVHTTTPAPQA